MALFTARRGRPRGASIRLASGQTHEFFQALRRRTVLLKLLLCMLAIVAMTISVQAWTIPVGFRLGQQPLHGIAAKTDFTFVNAQRTMSARSRAAEQVPFLFRSDPAPLTRLPEEFRTALSQFAQARSLEEVSSETRMAFGLEATPGPPAGPPPSAPAAAKPAPTTPTAQQVASFTQLKQIATDEQSLPGIVNALTKFLEPLSKLGLLSTEELERSNIRVTDSLAILDEPPLPVDGRAVAPSDPSKPPFRVQLEEVQIRQLLGPTGKLHAQWEKFPSLIPIRPELESWLIARAPETLHYDDVETEARRKLARDTTPDVLDSYTRGKLLVAPGEQITETTLAILQAEAFKVESQVTLSQRVTRVVAVFLMLLVLAILNGYYLVRNEPNLVKNAARLTIYLSVLVLTVAIGRVMSYDPWRGAVGPLLVTVMIFAIAYNQVLATVTAFSLCLIITLSTMGDLSRFVVLMSASATSVILLPRVPSRSTLVVVGFWAAATYFLLHWGMAILQEQTNTAIWLEKSIWYQSLLGAGWCLFAGFLVSGSLPFIESLFGVVTDISLLELGDVSHPLLQELVRRAPGTYNHSMTVASIAETAAESIGANGLLVRVGAYFHDIGKMLKPNYFIENTLAGEESRHDSLAPAMSTLIIIGHVKDGIDLGQQHNLPAPLIDFIEQHHGTTLVEYFFHEAARLVEEQPDHKTDAEESQFRYPGPKPQTKEAGVLMLADAVEGASRTLSEPTPKRIERLVHGIAMKRLRDGQFDDSGLTITELSTVEETLTKSLIAIYHGRIKYPEQRSA